MPEPEPYTLPYTVVLERDGMVIAHCHTYAQAEQMQRMCAHPSLIVVDE